MVLLPTPLNLDSCCLITSSGRSRRCSKQHLPFSVWRVSRMTCMQQEERADLKWTSLTQHSSGHLWTTHAVDVDLQCQPTSCGHPSTRRSFSWAGIVLSTPLPPAVSDGATGKLAGPRADRRLHNTTVSTNKPPRSTACMAQGFSVCNQNLHWILNFSATHLWASW